MSRCPVPITDNECIEYLIQGIHDDQPTAEPLQFEYEPHENEPLWSQLNKAALVQMETCPTSPLYTCSSNLLPSDPPGNNPGDP
ncbi:hypothetical protein HPB50_004376 [Hyalomma asiaticum]|uniref:Uncharacterized protein n=1 Tax=Hyalomma asiaticum TaxID=266040 RepID=A0ACB7SJY5_HYAAI|nr:hypothetical protein HPB50_004376 [Hyalomma asiaticum]